MERLGICIFLYRDIRRASNLLNSLSYSLGNSSEHVHVYIDYYDEYTSMQLYELVCRFNYVESILVRKKRHGLKLQVISAMIDMAMQEYSYTLFLEDDLKLDSQSLPWLRGAIDIGIDEIICLYSEFNTKNNKRLRRFSSWGYALSRSVIRQFIEYQQSKHKKISYHKLWIVGFDTLTMLRADRLGKINSWAIHFVCFQLLNGKKSLHPPQSLIDYCGLDGLGEHTNSNYSWVNRKQINSHVNSNKISENILLDIKYFFVMNMYSLRRKLDVIFR